MAKRKWQVGDKPPVTINEVRESEEVPPPSPPVLAADAPGTLADKATYRISEVAAYYDVDERTIRLWIEHGHLSVVYTGPGIRRVTRESLDLCRFRPRPLRFG